MKRILLSVIVCILCDCSDDIATVTVSTRNASSHYLFSDTRVYADGDLVDVIPHSTTKDIEVPDGAQLIANYEMTRMEPSIRITQEADTVTAKDGLEWKIAAVY